MEEILFKMNTAKTIYIVCAFVPIVIFIAAYRLKRSETVGFVIGLAANVGIFFAGIFSLIAATAFRSRVLEILCFAAVILIAGFLYYSILSKYISEAKVAVSFSLGISQASMIFCVLAVNLEANNFIWMRVQENIPPGVIEICTKLYITFMIMAAVKIILIAVSAFAAKKIYLSKKLPTERKAAFSAVIMTLCGVCADILLLAGSIKII